MFNQPHNSSGESPIGKLTDWYLYVADENFEEEDRNSEDLTQHSKLDKNATENGKSPVDSFFSAKS